MNVTGTIIDFKTGQPAKWHEIQVAAYAWLISKNWDKKEDRLNIYNPDFSKQPIIDENGKVTGHKYAHKKARHVFSVTEICALGGWQYTGWGAAQEGTWIHQAISLIDQNKFTYTAADLQSALWMKIVAYKKFTKDYPQFSVPGIAERSLCAGCGNKGTYIAGTFDKYIPGNWPLEILLLYLKGDGDYKLVPVDVKKIAVHMSKFRDAVSWLEYSK